MSLDDIVRWTLLVLLFGGLLGLWIWSKRKAAAQGTPGVAVGSSFKVLQKRWVDQRTGVCLVEAEEKLFLLAYTVGGGVSWQALDKAAPGAEKSLPQTVIPATLPEAGKR